MDSPDSKHLKDLASAILLRSTWKPHVVTIKVDGQPYSLLQLERRMPTGKYQGKKIVYSPNVLRHPTQDPDYEVALARLLADAEVAYADALERGDDTNADAA